MRGVGHNTDESPLPVSPTPIRRSMLRPPLSFLMAVETVKMWHRDWQLHAACECPNPGRHFIGRVLVPPLQQTAYLDITQLVVRA